MPAMRWKPVHITASGPPTVLELDGVGVVRLMEGVGGSWFAVLNYHLPRDRHSMRDCTSYEAGRTGAELWVQRHRDRLEREAGEARARWARLPVAEDVATSPRRSLAEIEAERERIIANLKVPPRPHRRRR